MSTHAQVIDGVGHTGCGVSEVAENSGVVGKSQVRYCESNTISEGAASGGLPLLQEGIESSLVAKGVIEGVVRGDCEVVRHDWVVLKMLPNFWQVHLGFNSQRSKFIVIADSRQHQDLRAADSSGRQDNLLVRGHNGAAS